MIEDLDWDALMQDIEDRADAVLSALLMSSVGDYTHQEADDGR